MNTQTFSGIDASNEISLLEYGLLVSDEPNEDGSGTHFCIYRIDENNFDCGHISESEVNGYILGNEFPNENDINSFLSFVGIDKDGWINMQFVSKLYDLLQYFGYENIFGTAYSAMNTDEAKERYL